MVEDLRIYGLNLGAIVFSAMPNINTQLQTVVLLLTIIYTATKIYKQFNGKD
jgi:uncharacterized membrane protein